MIFRKLAEKLIAAKTKSEREILLESIPEIDLVKLAVAVKEICYSFWTSQPTKAQASAQALENVYRFSPQKEIKAYTEWIGGIAEITRGNLVFAVKKLDASAAIFLLLGNELEAAQTQVGKLYVLALLGHYDEAVECGKKTLKTFKKHKDDLSTGRILHNLGNLFFRREIYRQAEKYQLSARQHFLRAGDVKQVAMIEHSLAVTYSALNNFSAAEKFYNTALLKAREAGMVVTQAEIESSLGYLALFRGRLKEALKFLELSRQKYETLKMPHQTTIAELEIADVYLELNLTAEAVSIYKSVVGQLRKLKMRGEEARARANFGRVAVALNDTQTARTQLKKAARLYVLEKNKVGAAAVKLNEAKLELDLRNYRKALRIAAEAADFLRHSGNVRHLLTARWLQAEALRNLSENEKAQKLLAGVFTESIRQEQPNTAQLAQISLGKLAVRRNNYRSAEKHFRRAIQLIETLRAPLAAEEFRMAFLADKLAPFENLAKIYLAENKIEKAFLIVERARARSLAESLADPNSSNSERQNKVSVKLRSKLETLREELNWFYSRLGRAGAAEIENLQREAEEREKQIADVLRHIASTGESTFGKPDFLDFKQLRNQLGERKALIEFVNFDGGLSAFVVTDKKIHFIANLSKEDEILKLLENLQFQFGSFRYGAKTFGKFAGELKRRANFYLQNLYENLFKPLESLIANRDLAIVPVGALHYVPFHALFDGTNYQIQRRQVTYAPSATVWQFLASKPQRKLRNALLIGYADERIPLVTQEIESLKRIFPKAKSYAGENATVSAFTKNAARFDVLHLACHGRFRPENPLFSSLHLADGWITVRDVCSQNLNAEVVTLSACETGLNEIFAGEEILGLARGFLAAGAKSLCLSLWAVNDEATSVLMQDFYARLRLGKTAAEALKIAQCNFIDRGVHPYFWSPFALIGR